MSDYTPTTEDVQGTYADEKMSQTYSWVGTWEEYAAEFDRWLAQHDAEVTQAEQKRIIEVLDKRLTTVLFDILVALIKGEQVNATNFTGSTLPKSQGEQE